MALPRKPDNVKTGKHSMNPDRGKPEAGSRMRTKSTIIRLNMYRNFKAKRDSKGKILRAAPFQGTMPSGTVSRVEPNRRWFGNTRVISQDALQSFKEAMKVKNPYEIMLRQTRLPISLLDEKKTKKKAIILSAESFADTFGKKAKRKRPQLSCDDLGTLVRDAVEGRNSYVTENDHNLVKEVAGCRDLVSDPHFKAGTSKRLWNELFKVIDSSDVILYVLDARDPMGTRSKYIEDYMKKEKPNKHFIFVINKVDLVPVWITKRWKTILSSEFPTLVFYANLTKPLGKNALMGLLRQLASLHAKDRHQISVGIIGYPNVGKSSIINAMRSKKVCKVAPLAGETKVWQYVTLLKSIYLIDCPGVVYPEGATESEMVMKGVVRVEYLQEPELYITDVLARVKPEYLQQRYNLPDYDPTCHPLYEGVKEAAEKKGVEQTNQEDEDNVRSSNLHWPIDTDLFLELVSKKTGKLLKGGDPDLTATAKRVLNDFQRGKLPYFVRPPDLPATEKINDDDEEEEEEIKEEESMVTDADKSLPSKEDALEEQSNCEEPSDEESGAFNLEPDSSDEEAVETVSNKASTSHSANNQKKSSPDGLSAARQRQLERALKRKQSLTGRHFYKEVNVKNRKRGLGCLPLGPKKKRSKQNSS